MLTPLLLLTVRGLAAQELLVPDFGFQSVDQAGVADAMYQEVLRELSEAGLTPRRGAQLPPSAVGLGETCLARPPGAPEPLPQCAPANKLLDELGAEMVVVGYVESSADGRSLVVRVRAYAWTDTKFPQVDINQALLPGGEAAVADLMTRSLVRTFKRLPPRPDPAPDPDPGPVDGPPDGVVVGPPPDGPPPDGPPPDGPPADGPPADGPPADGPPADGPPPDGPPPDGPPPEVPLPAVDASPCTAGEPEREALRLSPALYGLYCADTLSSEDWLRTQRVRAGQVGLEVQVGQSLLWVEEVYAVHTRAEAADAALLAAGLVQNGTGDARLALDQLHWTSLTGGSLSELEPGETPPRTVSAALVVHPSARVELGLRAGAVFGARRTQLLGVEVLTVDPQDPEAADPVDVQRIYKGELSTVQALVEPRVRWTPVARGPVKPYLLGALSLVVQPAARLDPYHVDAHYPLREGVDPEASDLDPRDMYENVPTIAVNGTEYVVAYVDSDPSVLLGGTAGLGLAVDITRAVSVFVEVPASAWWAPTAAPRALWCEGGGPGDGCYSEGEVQPRIDAYAPLSGEPAALPLTVQAQGGLQIRF